MFHYGTEKENYSNSTQEVISRFAIDSGADIVVGSHPHVIQGIEEYNGKVICYSLGNFSPTPLEGEEANRVLDRLKTYSTIYEDTIFNQ